MYVKNKIKRHKRKEEVNKSPLFSFLSSLISLNPVFNHNYISHKYS